jgi:hypothetical protein
MGSSSKNIGTRVDDLAELESVNFSELDEAEVKEWEAFGRKSAGGEGVWASVRRRV